jgi:hypothetical protein
MPASTRRAKPASRSCCFIQQRPDSAPDALLARVLEHIGQLTPVLADNEDVIAVLQAGFIGAWGEWHSSTNDLDSDANKQTILTALLAALPPSRMAQVRTPVYKSKIFGTSLADGEAYAGTSKARTGHHTDCFLASSTDYGTYPNRSTPERLRRATVVTPSAARPAA